jgi:hypothetical protein
MLRASTIFGGKESTRLIRVVMRRILKFYTHNIVYVFDSISDFQYIAN